MSMRPSERIDMRRNCYKVAVDAEQGRWRRRREDNMEGIRKTRRQESLLERRRGGGGDPMDFSWTADRETDPASRASLGRDEEATSAPAPAPAPSPTLEVPESILVTGRESDQLRDVSHKYENAKKFWAAAISNLEKKVKAMKQEQALLSLEAHDYANAFPDLNEIIGAVEALVAQCEDLKLKEKEEMCTALQQKIKELEVKLKEQEHDRSVVELSIKELEVRLKEQEHQRSVAGLKIKEPELKLKEQEHQRSVAELKAREIGHELLETQRTESMLQIKLRDLESKTKDQNRILRSSDALNKQRPEAGNEKKRKGDARTASIGVEQENSQKSTAAFFF